VRVEKLWAQFAQEIVLSSLLDRLWGRDSTSFSRGTTSPFLVNENENSFSKCHENLSKNATEVGLANVFTNQVLRSS
jgi:hypothetical protein